MPRATKSTDAILCEQGKKLTHDGQHCERSLIGCIKSCVHRPENKTENKPENWTFRKKK